MFTKPSGIATSIHMLDVYTTGLHGDAIMATAIIMAYNQ